jgi:hypothetical protein
MKKTLKILEEYKLIVVLETFKSEMDLEDSQK